VSRIDLGDRRSRVQISAARQTVCRSGGVSWKHRLACRRVGGL